MTVLGGVNEVEKCAKITEYSQMHPFMQHFIVRNVAVFSLIKCVIGCHWSM